MLVQNGQLIIRNLENRDKYYLVKWLSNPTVLKHYEGRDNPFDLEKINETFYKSNTTKTNCIFEYDKKAIGFIQFYPLDCETRILYGYDDKRIIYGTDQFIGEVEYWNKGIGTLLVNTVVNYLITEEHAEKIVMDPRVENHRAIRCYEKCGFRKIKLLQNREFHEGAYRDCLLMEYEKGAS